MKQKIINGRTYEVEIFGKSKLWRFDLSVFNKIKESGISDELFLNMLSEWNTGLIVEIFRLGFQEDVLDHTEALALYLEKETRESISTMIAESLDNVFSNETIGLTLDDLKEQFKDNQKNNFNVLEQESLQFNISGLDIEWFFSMKSLSLLLMRYPDLNQEQILEKITMLDQDTIITLLLVGIRNIKITEKEIMSILTYNNLLEISVILATALSEYLTPKREAFITLSEAEEGKEVSNFDFDNIYYMGIKELGLQEDQFWNSSPRKFFSILEAHIDVVNERNGIKRKKMRVDEEQDIDDAINILIP